MPSQFALDKHNLTHKRTDQVRNISVLGSTGTIGCNTLDLVSRNREEFEVVALTGNKNVELLAQQASDFNAKLAVVADEAKYNDLKDALSGTSVEVAAGENAVIEAAGLSVDWTMAAIVGAAGLSPTLQAVKQGKCIALANKECLVSAGELFSHEVELAGTTVLPVDSEHSAAFQAVAGQEVDKIEKMILTASGGPFREWSLEQLKEAKPEQALKHPNWSMGQKITIDSATLMNKGLELIEAWHLFPISSEKLDVLVHPQSIIHCLVSYMDGSVLSQMSSPDMRTPIAYSMAWPDRMEAPTKKLDLATISNLSFETPDEVRFPCLRIAKDVLKAGCKAGPVLNAANEVAVEAFLSCEIGFMAIPELIEMTLEKADALLTSGLSNLSLNDILNVDQQTRELAHSLLNDVS